MSQIKVPFIDLKRYENGFLENVKNRVGHALEEAHFVGGPERDPCETALKAFTKSAHLNLCANGTDAIQLALRAAGVKTGDKIIVPNFTFWASYEAIVNVGAIPIVVDVDPSTWHLNKEKCFDAFEKFNADGIMLVHLFGWATPQTEDIRKFCSDKGKIIVEDSAQAIGVKLNGKSLIGTAPLATTSFYPAKVLGASGDAGAVFGLDPQVIDLTRRLGDHGRINHYHHGYVGWNSRVGIYECIFLEESLKHLDKRIESRQQICQRYRDELKIDALEILSPAPGVEENGYLSVAKIAPALRPALIAHLNENFVGYGTVYPTPVSEQPGTKTFKTELMIDGTASTITQSVINLPCYAYMNESEQSYVIETVRNFFKKL